MLHSLLRFLSSRLDECTGNGEPGAMGSCSATAGGLRLGSLGLKSDALGLPSALARDRDNQLFQGLGQRRVRADTARGTLDCLELGDGRDSVVDGSCSRRRQLEEADRSSRTLIVRCSRTRAHTTYERISSWGSLAWPAWGRAPQQRADFALVLSASRVTPWARRVLWHAIATINSSGASGNDGYGPTRLAEPSIASTLGTAATLRSTALARDDGSWKKLTDRRGPCLCLVVVRARTRLMSVYPRGDRSRGQFFVDEEVLNF
jgi:hypothetical protein